MRTIRQEIIDLLSQEELTALEISRMVGIREKAVLDHLPHIARSMEARNKRLHITPPRCRECGYAFRDRRRFSRPSRCPRCKSEALEEPGFRVF